MLVSKGNGMRLRGGKSSCPRELVLKAGGDVGVMSNLVVLDLLEILALL
jgi:hypothetical protein